MPIKKKINAFTLLEALTVVVVVSILATIAFSIYNYLTYEQKKLRNHSEKLTSIIQLQRLLQKKGETSNYITFAKNQITFTKEEKAHPLIVHLFENRIITTQNQRNDTITVASVHLKDIHFNELNLVTHFCLEISILEKKKMPICLQKTYSQKSLWQQFENKFVTE